MAGIGLTGQAFSQAPQPMQISSSTTGNLGLASSEGSIATSVIAPVGQCLSHLPQRLSSAIGMQSEASQTACPIWVKNF